MVAIEDTQAKFNQLRRQAECLMRDKDVISSPENFEENPLKLIHELQIFQIELELQNQELQRSQQALMESQRCYAEFYNFAPVGHVTLNSKGIIYKCNLTFSDMLLIELTDLLNQPLSNYIFFEDQDIFYLHLRKLSDSKNRQVCELRMKKDAALFYVHLESTFLSKQPGNEDQYLMAVIDITERAKNENKLMEQKEQYRALVNNIGYYIIRYDRNLRHIYANQKALDATLLTVKQSNGESHEKMGFPQRLCELCKKNIEFVFDTGKQQNIEFDVEMVNGLRSFELQLNPEFTPEGRVQTVIGISRDVTKRKQTEIKTKELEIKLFQAHKIEAIGILAGGIAHDLNNILVPIIGYSEILQEDFPKGSDQQESITEILRAALRAKDLVKQILLFSRQSHQELKPVRLQSILEEALKLLKSSIPTTIDIQTDIDSECSMVISDPTQIHQIIMNLATNAYHSMQESGGKLHVSLKQTEIESNPTGFFKLLPGKYALLKVIDTGKGIKKDIMDKIFDPYFTTKETGKGTGLGLSMVNGIVKNYHGDIHVYSEPDKGTEVHVYLPIMKKRSKNDSSDFSEPIQGGTERILLVDDEEMIVNLEKKMLERLGYQVTSRTGSVDALEAFKANPDIFDLIISDMTMPNMTGLQLASKIRAVRSDIPFIICTGFSEMINQENSKEKDIQGYVAKPVIRRELARMIRDVLTIKMLYSPPTLVC